jgi:hypothetical protein
MVIKDGLPAKFLSHLIPRIIHTQQGDEVSSQSTQLSIPETAHWAGLESGSDYRGAQAVESQSFHLLVRDACVYRHRALIVRRGGTATATNTDVVISDRPGFCDVQCSSTAESFPMGPSGERHTLARVHGIYHATIALTRMGNIHSGANFRTFYFLWIQRYEDLLTVGPETITGACLLGSDFAFVDPTSVAPAPHVLPLYSRDEAGYQRDAEIPRHYVLNRYDQRLSWAA